MIIYPKDPNNIVYFSFDLTHSLTLNLKLPFTLKKIAVFGSMLIMILFHPCTPSRPA